MLLVSCKQCKQFAFVDCASSQPDAGRAPCSDPYCGHRSPDLVFDIAQPGCGCCTNEAHAEAGDCAAAANACPGGHAPCADAACTFAELAGGACPGHCGLGVEGCTVCRPLKVTIVPASGVVVRPVAAVGKRPPGALGTLGAQMMLMLLVVRIWLAAMLGAALDQTQASNILNAITPTGTAGIPGSYTALAASAMKLRLTTTDSTAAAAGTTLSGTGSGDYSFANASTASSAGSNVTMPNVAGGTGGTTFWTNGSGSAWNLHAVELQSSANVRNLWGLLNGDPVGVANGNSFEFAQNAITASLS